MLAGDCHGNFHHLDKLLKWAVKEECDALVQLGDWGFTWPEKMPKSYETFQSKVTAAGVPFFFLEGNHDNYDWLKQTGAWEADAPVEVGTGIVYLPRASTWEWDGLKFMAMGGAFSIDVDQRMPGLSWWEEELIRDADLEKAFAKGKVDILLSHDSPNNPTLQRFLEEHSDLVRRQGWDSYKLDRTSKNNRTAMTLVYQSAQPALTVHGHYHHYYLDTNEVTRQRIVGLNRDTMGRESYILLDTEKFKESHADAGI